MFYDDITLPESYLQIMLHNVQKLMLGKNSKNPKDSNNST